MRPHVRPEVAFVSELPQAKVTRHSTVGEAGEVDFSLQEGKWEILLITDTGEHLPKNTDSIAVIEKCQLSKKLHK